MAVLWLLVPWLPVLAWTGLAAADAILAGWTPPSGTNGEDLAQLVMYGWTVGLGIIEAVLLAFTWFWLALALPAPGPRTSLWVAASCIMLAGVTTRASSNPLTLNLIALLLAAAALCAVYAVIITRVRGQSAWAAGGAHDV